MTEELNAMASRRADLVIEDDDIEVDVPIGEVGITRRRVQVRVVGTGPATLTPGGRLALFGPPHLPPRPIESHRPFKACGCIRRVDEGGYETWCRHDYEAMCPACWHRVEPGQRHFSLTGQPYPSGDPWIDGLYYECLGDTRAQPHHGRNPMTDDLTDDLTTDSPEQGEAMANPYPPGPQDRDAEMYRRGWMAGLAAGEAQATDGNFYEVHMHEAPTIDERRRAMAVEFALQVDRAGAPMDAKQLVAEAKRIDKYIRSGS